MSPLTNIEEAIRGIASLVPQVSDELQTSEKTGGSVKKAEAGFAESSMEVKEIAIPKRTCIPAKRKL